MGSVGNLGSAAPLAVVGLASVFFYVLPALVFLVPTSLVAAELASGWEGGVYNAVVIIVLFWGGVLVVSRGQALVARLGSGGTRIGTIIPAAILVALGIAYLVQGHHPAAPMTASHLLPSWTGLASIVLVVNSFFTYAGVEVNAVHVDELRNPARECPRSIFLAMALVLAVFIGPTLAISWIIPSAKISFTTGVMQAFNALFTHFGLGFAVPLIAIALAVGALAGMISWLDGPSEGLLLIGRQQGFLPPYFQKTDRHGIEIRIIAVQGIVITLIAVLYALVPSVSHAFWIFTAMATQVYLVMYVLMFIAALRLRCSQPDHKYGYRAPALGLLCVLGTVSSVAALVIGFIPRPSLPTPTRSLTPC